MNKKIANVTVIIPCYKSSKTIMRAVDSIAHQTLLPSEVILIDDASSDECQTIDRVNDLVKKYLNILNIKVISLESNKGVANARNIGWNLAIGEYITFLDADDSWHPNKLEIQYHFMQENPEVLLCGHEAKILTDESGLDWPLGECKSKVISKFRLLISNPFVTPSIMIKRDIVFRFDTTKRYVDDHLLWLRFAFDNFYIVKLNLALTAIYKPMFGASGLSSHLWAMEKAELDNYWILFHNKNIGFISVLLLSLYSLAKYLRRLIIVTLR